NSCKLNSRWQLFLRLGREGSSSSSCTPQTQPSCFIFSDRLVLFFRVRSFHGGSSSSIDDGGSSSSTDDGESSSSRRLVCVKGLQALEEEERRLVSSVRHSQT
ncbi:hypothetical protein GBA52_014533, partial [Prunus armeniaca]